MVKISILALFIRLFTVVWIKMACMVGVCVCFVAMTALTIATIFQRIPIWANFNIWEPRPDNFQSINVGMFWKANAFWNIGSDVVLFLIPILMIKYLNFSTAHKMGLAVMLSFGLTVFACAILRFTTLGEAASGGQDILVSSYISTMWTEIEAALAVSCACLPMLKPLFTTIFNCFNGRKAASADLTSASTCVNSDSVDEECGEMVEPRAQALRAAS
jgi:hypothetical protein